MRPTFAPDQRIQVGQQIEGLLLDGATRMGQQQVVAGSEEAVGQSRWLRYGTSGASRQHTSEQLSDEEACA